MEKNEHRLALFMELIENSVLRAATDAEFLFWPGFLGDSFESGTIVFRWNPGGPADPPHMTLELAPAGRIVLEELVQDLKATAKLQMSSSDVEKVLLGSIAGVKHGTTGGRKALARAMQALTERPAGTVVVLPLEAVQWLGPPQRLRRSFCLGRLGDGLEEQITLVGEQLGLPSSFRFSEDDDFNWTEAFLSSREDPDGFVDFENPDFPVCAVVGVAATGNTAAWLAVQVANAVLGAAWAADQHSANIPVHGPWVRGSDFDRSGGLGVVPILHTDGGPSYTYLDVSPPEETELEEVLDGRFGNLMRAAAASDEPGEPVAAALGAASRRMLIASHQLDPTERLAQMVLALEAMLLPGADDIAAAVARRAGNFYSPGGTSSAITAQVKRAYRLRSRTVHEGLGLQDLDEVQQLLFTVTKLALEVARRTADAWAGGVATQPQHLEWLRSIGAS